MRLFMVKTLRNLSLATIVTACAACNTTAVRKAPPAKIEVEEAVGFTIKEEAKISADVRTEYDRALVLLQQGEHERGVALLESVAEKAPGLTAPRIDLGVAHHRAGNLEAAESNLELALELNAEHPVALNELGIVYRKLGRFDDAKRSYQAALQVYPGYHFARRNLAVLCDLYLADLDCALENYEAYMATVPSDDEASMWIADIRLRMGK